jgi:hypothetical protein
LGSDDEAVRHMAAEWLAEKKSLRAVPKLVELIRSDEREQAFEEKMVGLRAGGLVTTLRHGRLFTCSEPQLSAS